MACLFSLFNLIHVLGGQLDAMFSDSLNVLFPQQVRSLRVKQEQVFLDSDNLTDLRQLLVHIADSDGVALLHTTVCVASVSSPPFAAVGCLAGAA